MKAYPRSMAQQPDLKHLVSKCVLLFLNMSCIIWIYQIRLGEDHGVKLPEVLWKEGIHESSVSARLQLIQFKEMHRLHYSKERNKMYPNVTDTCDRCNIANGSIGHIPHSYVFPFWQDIYCWYCKMSYLNIEPDELAASYARYWQRESFRRNGRLPVLLVFLDALGNSSLAYILKGSVKVSGPSY